MDLKIIQEIVENIEKITEQLENYRKELCQFLGDFADEKGVGVASDITGIDRRHYRYYITSNPPHLSCKSIAEKAKKIIEFEKK